MLLETNGLKYQWIDNWITIPDTPTGRADGRTHGVAVSKTGDIFIFHQADPAVLRYDAQGNLKSSWGSGFPGAHGLTLVEEGGEEQLWLVDSETSTIVKTTLDGERLLELSRPDHKAYKDGATHSPTWAAVNEKRFGGNGDVWIADGYGSSLVHRYNEQGEYLATISGEEGTASKFDCPHAISFRFNNKDADAGNELFVADRGNCQVQVYTPDGQFKRAFGKDVLNSPCVIAFHGGRLVIPELLARIAILEADGTLVGYLGDNPDPRRLEGWPNVAATDIEVGKFNSPHSLAVDPTGSLYIVEWIIGGRVTKLAISS